MAHKTSGKMEKILLVVLFTVSTVYGQLRVKSNGTEFSNVDNLRNSIFKTITELQKDIIETNDINGDPTMSDLQLIQKFKEITKNISRVEEFIDRTELSILSISLRYSQIETEDDSIKRFFDMLIRVQKEPVKNNRVWRDIAQYFLDETPNGIKKTLNRLHMLTLPEKELSAFHTTQESTKTCELNQSQQQIIYQLYNMIATAELKGYVMINYAWMLLRIYEKGNFTAEANLLKNLYQDRTIKKMEAAKEAMKDADRSLIKCDPRKWIEGESYVRVTKLLQGYIENEVNLNPEGTCRENCRYYKVTEYHGCFKDQFCSQQRACKGKVLQCAYVDSDMDICQAPASSDRRYDWVSYENGRVLGNKGTCPNRILKVDSWWRYLFWHCSYCFCLCDDTQPDSDRYFNLREVKSDVRRNRVVTGVRFVKEKQVIHIQIQQGQLLERGVINKTSLEWVPVDAYSVLDDEVRNGVDYHTLNWQERSVDLDDIKAPGDHVVTGCRFRKIGTHLNLELRATPFDFDTGVVHPPVESLWMGNDNTDASFTSPRTEVHLYNGDVPTKHRQNLPDSKHDQFLNFRESSLTADVSQSTIPYIDAQPVESNGFPISGLGVYHRGTLNSGGVLAMKIITFDFSPHIILREPSDGKDSNAINVL